MLKFTETSLNSRSQKAFDSIGYLQTMDELDFDPTILEPSSAIDHLSNENAPGADDIPPEMIKSIKLALQLINNKRPAISRDQLCVIVHTE